MFGKLVSHAAAALTGLLPFLLGLKQQSVWKAALKTVVDTEIGSLFDHNPPDKIEAALTNWLASSSFGKTVLGQLALAEAQAQIAALLNGLSPEQARAEIITWVNGRLGVN